VRYFSATGLVVALSRGLTDNSVSRVIEQIMKAGRIQAVSATMAAS